MAYAVLWLFLMLLGIAFGAFVAVAMIRGWEAASGSVVTSRNHIASAVAGFFGTGVLLLAAWRRGLVVGNGDRVQGLGNYPIQRPGVVALLIIVQLAFIASLVVAILTSSALLHAMKGISSSIGDGLTASPASAIATILIVVVGAPVAEELFFRGWLWTGLQRSWSVLPTALITGILWLLVHLDGGLYRPLFLIPAAINLSLARYFSGSVRAPMLLHAINNAAALMLYLLPITNK